MAAKASWHVSHKQNAIGPLTEDQLLLGLLLDHWPGGRVKPEGGKWAPVDYWRRRFVRLAGEGWYVRREGREFGPLAAAAMEAMFNNNLLQEAEVRRGHDGDWRSASGISDWSLPELKRSPAEVPQKPLQSKVTCPHCWHIFGPNEVRWIANHIDLRGDPQLGPEALRRFAATRFNPGGDALDAKEQVCNKLACPRCHVEIPVPMLEMQPAFLSVLGAPGSGKSYFLAAAISFLRGRLAREANVRWLEAAAGMNTVLSSYLQLLFDNDDPEQLVSLPKTEMEGELYQSIHLEGRDVWLPKPFPFTVAPASAHPRFEHRRRDSRIVCLYDNAGEHFLPGQSNVDSFATHHLEKSAMLIFLYDPTQNAQLRNKLRSLSDDPQLKATGRSYQQSSVLQEVVDRVRNHRGLAGTDTLGIPLTVVVTKFDVWRHVGAHIDLTTEELLLKTTNGAELNVPFLRAISQCTLEVINEYDPDLALVAESASDDVIFMPASSMGVSPHFDEATQQLKTKPQELAPEWPDTALLYALHRIAPRLLPGKPEGNP